jgi:hypothetical protein
MLELIAKQEVIKNDIKGTRTLFSWQDSPPVKQLLDVISSIIAQEYVRIAKENPDVFMDIKEKGGEK